MATATVSQTIDVIQPSRPIRVRALRLIRRQPLGAFGAVVVVALVVVAVLADVLAPANPLAQTQRSALLAPSVTHLAGTDQFGRDLFSRLIYGARVSLFIGIGAVVFSIIPATLIGIFSAYFGGAFDYLVQRVVDAIQALPGIIVLIVMITVLGPSLWNMVIVLAFNSCFRESRVVRSATIAITESEYVSAARALGATDVRLMFRHILPNIVSPIIVVASLSFGQFILAEATLSFLGYGILPPAPSWGGMLAAEGRAYMFAAPWLLWAPAIALSLVVFGANMFGDALRDEFDPRLRGSR